jgi:hypothetical protein
MRVGGLYNSTFVGGRYYRIDLYPSSLLSPSPSSSLSSSFFPFFFLSFFYYFRSQALKKSLERGPAHSSATFKST